jgi:predicted MFS family arabinose efflux permease
MLQATRDRPRVLVAVLVFLAVESTAVASLGTPLLATIQRADHVSLAASQWALTVTLLAGSVATPLLGRLGDGRLRRPVTLGTVTVMLAGCVLSALPAGFTVFLAGRALQGAGFGLVPLATAVARDSLPAGHSRPAIAWIGVTTAVGIGIGYPLVGLLAQYLGLGAPFWCIAILSALALAAAAAALPPSPERATHADLPGAALLGLGITALLLLLAQGPVWGWAAPASLACAAASVVLLVSWAMVELRTRHPLVDLRLLRPRPVLAANVTAFLVALGFYPLASLVVRFVQTPAAAGYGFGAPVVVAGLMLAPFSLASLAAVRIARPLARRTSAELVVAASCVVLIAAMLVFLTARSTYWEIVVAMALAGFGVGCVYAVNPLQITGSVPAAETGSAISFYQVARTVAYSLGSAMSATVLVLNVPRGGVLPAASGYSAAALVSVVILVGALVASTVFALPVAGHRKRGPAEEVTT